MSATAPVARATAEMRDFVPLLSGIACRVWKDWRGTLAKLPWLRAGFYASARRAGRWTLVSAVMVAAAGRPG